MAEATTKPNLVKARPRKATLLGLSPVHIASAALVAFAAVYLLYIRGASHFQPPDLTPLHAPKMTDLPEFKGGWANDMLWGSYRSGLYFGMRTRSPKSLLAGLMWFNPDSPQDFVQQRVRHLASQDDQLARYGWERHDGRSFGRQTLVDGSVTLTLSMVKVQGAGKGPGGDWAVRIKTSRTPKHAGPRAARVSLVMYLADEDTPKSAWRVLPGGEPTDLKEPTTLACGANSVVGEWSFHMLDSSKKRFKVPPRLDYLAVPSLEGGHDLKQSVRELLLSVIYEQMERDPASEVHLTLPNGVTTGSDLAMFQVSVQVGSSVDFVFLSAPGQDPAARVASLSGAPLTQLLLAKEQEFDSHFERVLGPVLVPMTEEDYYPRQLQEASKAALSNLLGSMGYFYGSSQVRLSATKVAPYWPAPLFTAVPSRSFFPRGFLWDEGFHQLLINRWDPRLSREVLSYWLDLMNSRGWIPREQILGAEAAARVPAEFVVQDPAHANPPSLFLVLLEMAKDVVALEEEEAHQPKSGQGSGEVQEGAERVRATRSFLHRAWPRLEAWFNWYNTTQAGPLPHSYRWHGRNTSTVYELNPKTLTSGLDDFPRASHPTADERHLDLRCWMALAANTMATIGGVLGLSPEVVEPYLFTSQLLSDMPLLDALHWDEASQQHLDWGLHSEAVALQRTAVMVDGRPQEVAVRVVREEPRLQYVPHFGYVSLFPLLMRILPPGSPRLGELFVHINASELLWTSFGLRSLSAASSLYRQHNTLHDPPYWRGQVWVNINFLALSALKYYATTPGPYQQQATQIHLALNNNLLQTLVSQYYDRGYLFEQYDDRDGRGVSSHPFTGWTALLTLIAADMY
ncbi:glycoside hydrolase [Haematococcus lacustris]